jgi:hypothetical protein
VHNSRAHAYRDYANRKGVTRNLYDEYREGTGSVIVEDQSAAFQGVPRVWMQLNTAAECAAVECNSATTGIYVVITKNQIDSPEALTEREFNLEASLPPIALSPAFVLESVRAVFGLNISETAEVFGITRQTTYQWMKLSDMEQVRSHENRERIKQLYGAVQLWRKRPSLKGRWLHALLAAGNTVFDLLKAFPVDLDALQAAYQALTTGADNRRREEGERTTQAVNALAEAFEGLGAGRKSRKGAS